MNKRNFALMAVLYDTKEADLYHDIYFPIIKYCLATLSSSQVNPEKYYELANLQAEIISQFGINIPLIVLKQSILAVSRSNSDITLSLYDKGSKFQIKKSWDIALNDSIEDQLTKVVSHFDKLEAEFQLYLKNELLSTEKTFLEFFSDNTEEIFRYIDQLDSVPVVNENYIHIARFLSDLNKTQNDLFIVANNIFWGSVISAFLRREVDLNIKPVDKVAYYLDSSLVMSLLDLNSEANVSYCNELLEIIKASGNVVHVHPLTLKEVNSILYSVEKSQAPNANSSIESAYYRRSLTPSLVLQIRNSLSDLIEEKGIIIDVVSEKDLEEILLSYRKKTIVLELKNSRSQTFSDNIRDIHDVYMSDFIKKKRGDISTREKVNSYFVSLNNDLMYFIKQKGANHFPTIIHPSKIVSELWIHNSKSTLIKKNGLTEIMSRCIALNNTDVRRKLRLITKYFDDSNYSEENYIALYQALINRSEHVLQEISQIDTDHNPDLSETSKEHLAGAIRIALEEELKRTKSISYIQRQYNEVSHNLEDKNKEIVSSKSDLKTKAEENKFLKNKKAEQEKLIANLNRKLLNQQRLSSVKDEIIRLNGEIFKLEKERDSSVNMFKFWAFLIIELFVGLFLILSIIYLTFILDFSTLSNLISSFHTPKRIITLIIILFSIIFGTIKAKQLYLFSPYIYYAKIKIEQLSYWEERNINFRELINKRNKLLIEQTQTIKN